MWVNYLYAKNCFQEQTSWCCVTWRTWLWFQIRVMIFNEISLKSFFRFSTFSNVVPMLNSCMSRIILLSDRFCAVNRNQISLNKRIKYIQKSRLIDRRKIKLIHLQYRIKPNHQNTHNNLFDIYRHFFYYKPFFNFLRHFLLLMYLPILAKKMLLC